MTQWTRTIGRQITNAYPAWRSAMVTTDQLYQISSTGPGLAAPLNPLPATLFGTYDTSTSFGTGREIFTGFASGTHLAGYGGQWGTMVYGSGYHDVISNHIVSLDLNGPVATYGWYQQPIYATADDGVTTDCYYSPTYAAELAAGPRGSAAVIPGNSSSTGWDRQFPVAFRNWIYPRKQTTSGMGGGAGHGYRYAHIGFLPGIGGQGVLVNVPRQGVFAGPSDRPTGATVAEWFQPEAISGSSRRMPYYVKNVATGQWAEYKYAPTIGADGLFQVVPVPPLNRVYVLSRSATYGTQWWYLDFSSGVVPTLSSVFNPATYGDSHQYCTPVYCNSQGRHLIYTTDSNRSNGLIVIDIVNNTLTRLNLGLVANMIATEQNGLGYDPEYDRLIITKLVTPDTLTGGAYYLSIPLPADHTNAAGYIATQRMLSIAPGNSPTLDNGVTNFYGKTRYMEDLKIVMLPMSRDKMMAFRPSPP